MITLAVDTSTRACILALDTGQELLSDEVVLDNSHSQEVLPRIDALISRAGASRTDIERVVYGRGPGSFTGLRIGIGVVQGLAFGLGVPVAGVSTLACLALQAHRKLGVEQVFSALLARQEEIYCGAYEIRLGVVEPVGREAVLHAEASARLPQQGAWAGVGNMWHLKALVEKGTGVRIDPVLEVEHPEAIDLMTLGKQAFSRGEDTDALNARPEYLRETVASLPKK